MDSLEFLKLNEQLASLESMIIGLQNMHREAKIDGKDRSHDLGDLMGALSKAQSEMKIAGKDSNNPFFKSKYADLASVVAASRPSLAKNGLSVMQQITLSDSGDRVLVTILGHSSGQYISSTMKINPSKEDVQSLGSAITYLRRYAYASLVGVVADDEDDDGEVAMKPVRQSNQSWQAPRSPEPQQKVVEDAVVEKISKDQLDMIQRQLADMPDLANDLLTRKRLKSLADIPRSQFEALYDRILEIKEESKAKQ